MRNSFKIMLLFYLKRKCNMSNWKMSEDFLVQGTKLLLSTLI